MIYDVAIIGAGVIGGMTARELSKFKLSAVLLEKENDVACGSSRANSGIIHGGFDPEPGTLKARLNTAGVPRLYETAKELNVPHIKNGSMVCAFNSEEDKIIKDLYDRGIKNNIKNLHILSGDDARSIEPNLSKKITSVLHIPNAGIICPYQLTVAAIGNAMDNGVELKTGFEVCSIKNGSDYFEITSSADEKVSAKYIINCAGGYSDRISSLIGDNSFKIIPRGGEYMLFDKTEGSRVSHTIFQVPSKDGKGILVSPTADGNLLIGPTAAKVETPDNTETTVSGLDAVRRLSQKSVPGIDFRQVITSFSGVRASESRGDFIILPSDKSTRFINVAAIDSPGLTCCVSIAEYVVDILHRTSLSLVKKENWNGFRKDMHYFEKMTDEEKNECIKSNPTFGKIICRCEKISEGEIREAIRTNPPARDVDGIKRRTRSGMGRCQGGFCLPNVMRILADEMDTSIEDVTKSGKDSHYIIGKI